METGLCGVHGEFAALLVEEESVVESEAALILLHKMEEDCVLGRMSKLIIATLILVQVSIHLETRVNKDCIFLVPKTSTITTLNFLCLPSELYCFLC